jgi:hypothetical protein
MACPMVSLTEEAVHPYLLEDLVTDRIDELHRQVDRERRGSALRRPTAAGRMTARSLRTVGFWLIGAGLRLAMAGAGRGGMRDG